MKATFEDFLIENSNCSGFTENVDAIEIFELLSEDEVIIDMIELSDQGRPALEACIKRVESWYSNQSNNLIDLNDDFTRKAIGRMIKTILLPFGYEVCSRKAISKQCGSNFFTSASCYKKTGIARLKVVKKIEEM